MEVDTKTVRQVLLPDGGWHRVEDRSFLLEGFSEQRGDEGYSALWFRFRDLDSGEWISGPIASIHAIAND